MEIPSLQGLTIEQGLLTQERSSPLHERHKSMRIGVPREVSNEERRVALAPSGITSLVAAGHEVYVESQAGVQAHFMDVE
jgi:alanine dehydrogenase